MTANVRLRRGAHECIHGPRLAESCQMHDRHTTGVVGDADHAVVALDPFVA